jgi:hypothetical protein
VKKADVNCLKASTSRSLGSGIIVDHAGCSKGGT